MNTVSTPPPSVLWRIQQALKGTNATLLKNSKVPEKDLTGKWIIITGANNGIGFEAAKTFAKWGANLIMACREPPEWETHPSAAEKECKTLAESAGHASVIEWWELDLTDLGSIDRFATKWVDANRPLHILCNNAGVTATPGAQTIYTKDGFEYTHQKRLLRSEKLKHITVNGINPGYVNSGIWNNPRPDIRQSFLEARRMKLFQFLARKLAITPEQGSIAIVNAATSPTLGPDPEIQGVGAPGGKGGGHYINRIWLAEPMPYCADENARREVWERVGEELRLAGRGQYDVFDN
ncbi:alcohol dehydrogenase pan2 [Ilyonectria robusta]